MQRLTISGLVFSACLLLGITANGVAERLHQEDIPKALEETFRVMYPDLRLMYWEREGENFSATYKEGKGRGSMLFDADANLLETESEIPIEELPKPVNSAAQKLFGESKIMGAGKIVDYRKQINYKVKSDTEGLVLDGKGTLIRRYKLD